MIAANLIIQVFSWTDLMLIFYNHTSAQVKKSFWRKFFCVIHNLEIAESH